MPKQTRYTARGGGQPPPRRPAPAAVPVGPLLGMLVLIGVAVVAARFYAAGTRAEEATRGEAPAHVPFASVPDEQPPPRRAGAGARAAGSDVAPPGLEASPVWQEALGIAARADEAMGKARDARERNDSTATQQHSREARDAYDEALTLTAELEEELLERYGDLDRQVRQIVRTRDSWFRQLTALHKTTGR